MHVTYCFFYDHDATQSECAHRLVKLHTKNHFSQNKQQVSSVLVTQIKSSLGSTRETGHFFSFFLRMKAFSLNIEHPNGCDNLVDKATHNASDIF